MSRQPDAPATQAIVVGRLIQPNRTLGRQRSLPVCRRRDGAETVRIMELERTRTGRIMLPGWSGETGFGVSAGVLTAAKAAFRLHNVRPT
jgi:hypothetical protein